MIQDQIQEFHPHREATKRRVVWIITLLLVKLELPEIPTYIAQVWPSIKTARRDWFFSSSYKFSMDIYWYLKFSAEDLAWIICMFAFTKAAVNYSTTVFLASFLIFLYHIADLFMFWYNYNTSVYIYEFLILFLYFVIRGLIRPYKPDAYAKIRSMF